MDQTPTGPTAATTELELATGRLRWEAAVGMGRVTGSLHGARRGPARPSATAAGLVLCLLVGLSAGGIAVARL